MLGFAAFIAIIPLFPEITEVVKETYSNVNQLTLFDKVSSLYTNAFAVGNIFGPMVGAHLTDEYGFRSCCDTLAVITVCHFLLYFFIIDGVSMCKRILGRVPVLKRLGFDSGHEEQIDDICEMKTQADSREI